VSDYQQTLPSLECDEWKKECIAASTSLATNTFCLSFVRGNNTAVTPMSTPSSSAGAENPSSTATATGGPETSASHSAATALRAGRDYGTGALAFGLVSLFALLL
jgi:hypothetical protein